jgi:hypothetical protein
MAGKAVYRKMVSKFGGEAAEVKNYLYGNQTLMHKTERGLAFAEGTSPYQKNLTSFQDGRIRFEYLFTPSGKMKKGHTPGEAKALLKSIDVSAQRIGKPVYNSANVERLNKM